MGMVKGSNDFSFAVVTMSDKGAAGKREDTSGEALLSLFENEGYSRKDYRVIPDNVEIICSTLKELSDKKNIDLIITTGGTGVSPSDVTPEAMKKIIHREIPGMAEAMRAASLKKTIRAMISRGICGVRGATLIINLPGSKKGALENIEVILPAIPHALEKIMGDQGDCGQ